MEMESSEVKRRKTNANSAVAVTGHVPDMLELKPDDLLPSSSDDIAEEDEDDLRCNESDECLSIYHCLTCDVHRSKLEEMLARWPTDTHASSLTGTA